MTLRTLFVLLISQSLFAGNSKPLHSFSGKCLDQLRALGPGNGWIYATDVRDVVRPAGNRADVFHRFECEHCGEEGTFKPTDDGKVACKNCSSSPEHDVQSIKWLVDGKWVLQEQDLARTEKEAEAAQSGKKWVCPSCGTLNMGSKEHCAGCGDHISEGKRIHISTVERRLPNDRIGRSEEGVESKPPASDRTIHEKAKDLWERLKTDRKTQVVTGSIGAGVMGLLGGVAWLFSTDEIEGKVTDMSWEHSYDIQTFSKTTKRDWRDDIVASNPVMPVNSSGERAGAFNIRNCNSEIHHYRQVVDHYETYQEWVNDPDPSPSGGGGFGGGGYGGGGGFNDNGNGSSTIDVTGSQSGRGVIDRFLRVVPNNGNLQWSGHYETRSRPVYRSEPVYRLRCDYDTYEWQTVDTKRVGGTSADTGQTTLPWPQVELGSLQRKVPHSRYQLKIQYGEPGEEETINWEDLTESEFVQWQPRDKAMVTRRKIGTVTQVQKIPAEK